MPKQKSRAAAEDVQAGRTACAPRRQRAPEHRPARDTYAMSIEPAIGAPRRLLSSQRSRLRCSGELSRGSGLGPVSWDVFDWAGTRHPFVRGEQKSGDQIRKSQVRCLAAAIASGVPLDAFLIVEWSACQPDGYRRQKTARLIGTALAVTESCCVCHGPTIRWRGRKPETPIDGPRCCFER